MPRNRPICRLTKNPHDTPRNNNHPPQLEPEHTLQLQPGERAVSVSWQNLATEPPLEPSRCAAALLTTRRLLLVAGDLRVLAEVASAGEGAAGVPHAITSFVWAGPALLYMTAGGQVRAVWGVGVFVLEGRRCQSAAVLSICSAPLSSASPKPSQRLCPPTTIRNQVMQLTWTGETHHVASVAAFPTPVLAGALADSLLLLRPNPANGELEVASRAVNMLQPLVLGWCSLAASGLLPKLNSARAALQQVWGRGRGRFGAIAAVLPQPRALILKHIVYTHPHI